jgi:hypothetical protein
MSRMNSRNRKKYLPEIIKRDGGIYCFIGGEPLNPEDACIDHWCNDDDDNEFENLHVLCKSMNAVKNPRGRDKRHKVLSPVCGNVYTDMINDGRLRANSIEILINLKSEPNFNHWLFWKISHNGEIPFEEALDGGATFARCSQETVRRYLKKDCCELGLYRLVIDTDTHQKIIILKPEWETFRVKKEEKKKMSRVLKNWKKVMNEDIYPPLVIDQKKERGNEENAGQ